MQHGAEVPLRMRLYNKGLLYQSTFAREFRRHQAISGGQMLPHPHLFVYTKSIHSLQQSPPS